MLNTLSLAHTLSFTLTLDCAEGYADIENMLLIVFSPRTHLFFFLCAINSMPTRGTVLVRSTVFFNINVNSVCNSIANSLSYLVVSSPFAGRR